MLSLNLLTPERKKIFYWTTLTKKAIFWGVKMLSILFIFSFCFLVFNLYLDYQINILDQNIASFENTKKVKEMRQIEESSKKINKILDNIDNINENQIYWHDALVKFVDIIPDKAQIFSLEIGQEGKFTISGMAKTRQDLLFFEAKLKNSEEFKNVRLPLEDLIKKEDVDFQLAGEFLLNKFKTSEKIKLSPVETKIE